MISLLLSLALADSAEALKMLDDGKALTARRLAEEALVGNPDDFVAHYVVGKVAWLEDGNLPRGLYHLRHADELYKAQKSALDSEAWRTHFYVLKAIVYCAKDLEQRDLALRTTEEFNRLYSPKLLAETGWTLMKEGRMEDAEKVATTALASDDAWQRTLGYNVMCTLESKRRHRAKALKICNDGLIHARSSNEDITVDAYNVGLSALSALDFDFAMERFDESAAATVGDPSNPHMHRALMFASQAKGAEAAAALKKMQRWRFAQEPAEQSQSRSTAEATLATVLLVAGQSDRATEIITRVLDQPDRRASTSTSHEVSRSQHTLLGNAIRRLQHERDAEATSMRGLLPRAWAWLASWLPDVAAWRDRTVMGGLHADADLLARSVAPYDEDGGVGPTWLIGDLVELLGPGVVQAAIDRGRLLEDHPGLDAYYDGLETEVAWARGDRRTLELATRALANLPEQEVLLRARIAARAADHAYSVGDPAAMGLYERTLQLDPGTLRRLGQKLPAAVQASDDPTDQAIGAMLERSPRFTYDRSAFIVTVQAGEICLVSPLGTRLGCHRGAGQGDVDARATAAVQAFYDGAFALPLGLSTMDMDSLDGTTRLSAEAKKKALEQVLGGL